MKCVAVIASLLLAVPEDLPRVTQIPESPQVLAIEPCYIKIERVNGELLECALTADHLDKEAEKHWRDAKYWKKEHDEKNRELIWRTMTLGLLAIAFGVGGFLVGQELKGRLQ